MGLDMYLEKSIYVGACYEYRGVTGSINIMIGEKPLLVNLSRVSTIEERIGYWRKANQIHKWFVDNVQNGEDNCERYFVETFQLKELLELCQRVQADHSLAPELLPSQDGFFFGTDEYDEWYFKDIDYTIKMLGEVLSESDSKDSEYYYRASW